MSPERSIKLPILENPSIPTVEAVNFIHDTHQRISAEDASEGLKAKMAVFNLQVLDKCAMNFVPPVNESVLKSLAKAPDTVYKLAEILRAGNAIAAAPNQQLRRKAEHVVSFAEDLRSQQ